MRLAIFTDTETGRRFAMQPTGAFVAETRATEERAAGVAVKVGDGPPLRIQGTFEEAVDEVNSALGETIFKMKGKLVEQPLTEKTGKCIDCGEPVCEWQERCVACYQPVSADEAKPPESPAAMCPAEAIEEVVDALADTPAVDPISVTIIKDGGESEQITFTDNLDPCDVTAARINAELRKHGYDASMVSAMTPLHMLENAERRMASAEERRKKAQDREQAWVNWFEEIRMKYDGVNEQATPPGAWTRAAWRVLEEVLPWPSLEDELAQAIQDGPR